MPITTARLILRPWLDSDRAPFAAMNADPEVMRHFESTLTANQTDAAIARYRQSQAENGFCFWAVEIPGQAPFIGLVGLGRIGFDAPFAPAVEVGWRLAQPWWGRGHATEAATAALAYGFENCGLDEIVAITVPGNAASQAVMRRIGMTRDADGDFDHPNVPEGHKLRRHVLYRTKSKNVLF